MGGFLSKLWGATPIGAGVNAINRERDASRRRKAGRVDANSLYDQAIVNEGNGGGWEDAFNRTAGAAVNRALPQLRDTLQMSREDAVRRGVSTGDYQTSREGDLASAWQKNLADALGGMAMGGYENSRNRYLDLLTGRLDRNQASKNARNQTMMGGAQSVAQILPMFFGGG